MVEIKNKRYEEERSLYNLKDTSIVNCIFKGEKDGESPLKEARNIKVLDSSFSLRYPLWHVIDFEVNDTSFDEYSRAPIWYSKNGTFDSCSLNSIKAIRECDNIIFKDSNIESNEFGWKSSNIKLIDSEIVSEYIFLDSSNVELHNVKFKGKYSFQYMHDLLIEDSILDTKDAFWHSNKVVVKNSIVKGEYLAWYSDDLTFINCAIIGTQPFCYCKNLKLINCQMLDTDFSFEYSDVDAEIKGNIMSIKNPRSGRIVCDSVDDIILEDAIYEDHCEIIIRNK